VDQMNKDTVRIYFVTSELETNICCNCNILYTSAQDFQLGVSAVINV